MQERIFRIQGRKKKNETTNLKGGKMISNIAHVCYRIGINEEDFKKIINYDSINLSKGNILLDKLEENDRILAEYSSISSSIYLNINFDNTKQHFYDLHDIYTAALKIKENAKKIIRKYIKEAREAAKEENA